MEEKQGEKTKTVQQFAVILNAVEATGSFKAGEGSGLSYVSKREFLLLGRLWSGSFNAGSPSEWLYPGNDGAEQETVERMERSGQGRYSWITKSHLSLCTQDPVWCHIYIRCPISDKLFGMHQIESN